MSWTTEQQMAIDTRNKSLLVSAAAGSGKTAVLVERIITMICDPVNPVSLDRLLIVTFTNAAATEMKERIGAAIQKALLENPMSESLYRQSLLLRDAKITTLHSFCLDFVRQNFFHLGIDPDMRIADETERILLLQETLEEVLEDHYSEDDNGIFLELMDSYGGSEDESVQGNILQILRMAESMPNPEGWMAGLGEEDSVNWFGLAKEEIQNRLSAARKSIMEATILAQSDEGLKPYLALFEYEYNSISELLSVDPAEEWERLDSMIHSVRFDRLPTVKKGTYDEETKDQAQAYRNQAKDLIGKIRDDYFNRPRDVQEQELRDLQVYQALLAELAIEVFKRFRAKKLAQNMMDFSDMEHYCYELFYEEDEEGKLQLTQLAMDTKARFDEVMVDEYQDINNLQEGILQAVSREDNRFMVGDIKQSIYGFRMANPALFQQKYEDYAMETGDHKRIDLNKNFRCREGVIQGTNHLFRQLMDGKAGDITYDDNAALVYGADYPVYGGTAVLPDERVKLFVIDKSTEKEPTHNEDGEGDNKAENEKEEIPRSDSEKEAIVLGKQLLTLKENATPVLEKGTGNYRPMNWRDAVILLRSPKSTGKIYADVLKQMGIPVALDVGDGYFSSWEIELMICLLQIVDNPLQDIPLAAVMKAPFIGFTDEELAIIRMQQREGELYFSLQNICSPERDVVDGLREKTEAFLNRLDYWRMLSHQKNLSEFLRVLYRETGFYKYVGALSDGVQRQANLRALEDRARAYENTSYHGVFAFLQFLKQMQENGEDLEPARIITDSENVVRIMSIHKSKGLEFPVVFVGGIGHQFNLQDTRKEFLLDEKLGMAISYADLEKEIKYKTIAQRVIAAEKLKKLQQEEKRVLYVAMTRAREYLYLIGTSKDVVKQSVLDFRSGRSYLDWVLSADHTDALWETSVMDTRAIETEEEAEKRDNPIRKALLEGREAESEGNWMEEICSRLEWNYRDPEFESVKGLYSVSELKKKQTPATAAMDGARTYERVFEDVPNAVRRKEGLTGAEKGTLMHEVLQHVSLGETINEESLERQIRQMIEKRILDGEYESEINRAGILGFYGSEIGKRLINAYSLTPENVYRELPFMLSMDSHEVDAELPEGRKNVVVQGIIDCLWKEEDGWILLDYKSDRVPRETAADIIRERYSTQIRLYRRAVETILGEPVKEAYFYLLSLDMVIPV